MTCRCFCRAITATTSCLVAVLLNCFALSYSFGQASMPAQTLPEMYHTAWTVREGAPSNIISSTLTKDGYLWLATDDGLSRFDGVTFQHYHPVSGYDFPSGVAESLLPTPDGGLWIGYPAGVISFLKDGHNTNYDQRDGVPTGNITEFALSSDGTLWAASVGGLMRHAASGWQHIALNWSYPEAHAASVYFDHHGTLWVGSGKQLLYLPQGQQAFRVALTVDDDAYTIAEAPDGTIWVALHQSSIFEAVMAPDGALLKKPVMLRGYKTASPYFAHDGSLWLPTDDDGLYRIPASAVRSQNPAQWPRLAEHMSVSEGLTSKFAYGPLEDGEGDIWLTSNKGLDQFRPAALTNVAVPADFNRIASSSDGAAGLIVAGTGGTSALHVFSDGTSKPIPGPNGIYCIYRDPEGTVWLGGDHGLWRSAGDTFKAISLPAGIDPALNIVSALTKDLHGDLWASFLRKGIFRLHDGLWTQPQEFAASAQESAAVEVTDGAGRVWFGLKHNRINIFDGQQLKRYGPESGIAVDTVISLYPHGDQMWIGGERGLQYFKDARFQRLQLAGDIPLTGISGIVQTQSGDLWLNTALGVVLIPAGEVLHAQADPQYKALFRTYSYLDGLVGTAHQLRPTPSVIQATDGKLWFGTRTGLAWLDPSHLSTNTRPPSVFITSLEADGRLFRDPEGVRLPVHTRSLQFSYTATSLAIPQRVRFRYMLQGFDKEWQDAGTRRQAFYSALPPGNYQFVVVACNNDGLWNQTKAGTTFSIPPSFLQSVSFKALCSIVLLCLLGVFYRLRIRVVTQQVRVRLYERLAERERIARDLHDTFFQGIQGLLLRFNTGTSQLKQEEPARAIFEEALQESDRVMLEGREFVLDLRTGFGTLQSLATILADAGAELNKTREANFKVSVLGEHRELHPVVFEEVYRIGREALANAFRHSQADTIEADLNYGAHELRLRVRDNGIGLENSVLASGNRVNHWGLPGMRERSQKIGAQIDIWSRKGAGTEIELRVPASLAYRSIAPKQRFASWGRLWQSDTESYD